MSAPRATKETSLKELTLRGIIIGGIITLVFTAANVYLGLKVGLTFATSIPAAVISGYRRKRGALDGVSWV